MYKDSGFHVDFQARTNLELKSLQKQNQWLKPQMVLQLKIEKTKNMSLQILLLVDSLLYLLVDGQLKHI